MTHRTENDHEWHAIIMKSQSATFDLFGTPAQGARRDFEKTSEGIAVHKEMSEKDRASLIDYVSPATILERSQYALLFGSGHAQAPLMRRAAALFKEWTL